VPTVAESGVPRFSVAGWNGLGTTGGTPAALVDRLNREANAAMAAPDVRKRLEELYLEPRGGTPRADGHAAAKRDPALEPGHRPGRHPRQ
jgi:tripartite-type tricarboxylate transporter receptor subunit TctC